MGLFGVVKGVNNYIWAYLGVVKRVKKLYLGLLTPYLFLKKKLIRSASKNQKSMAKCEFATNHMRMNQALFVSPANIEGSTPITPSATLDRLLLYMILTTELFILRTSSSLIIHSPRKITISQLISLKILVSIVSSINFIIS